MNKIMKKLLVIFTILALLVLDYAALDDITTGNEPNFYLEYIMLGFSALFFAIIGIKFIKIRR